MNSLDAHQYDAAVILDSINDGVVTISLDKKIMYLNRAAERLLGYTLEEAREMSCAAVIHSTACGNNCLLEQTISTGRHIRDYESILKNRNGQVITISSNTALLKDREGRILGGVEIIRDRRQVEALTEQLRGKYSFENIIGKNHQMQEIYTLLPEVAKSQSPVLINGEPGTGKELVAHAIHQNSRRRDNPFIKVPCGILADGLLASELFGHVKGAFAGALSNKMGRFEIADEGTLFLEEIGGVGPSLQTRLQRFLETAELERVGDNRRIRVDVRVIATTSRDLKAAVEQGEFLERLYDRLRVVLISLPPLRERRDDIPLLISYFVKRLNMEMKKKIESVTSEAMEVLLNYDYPGNIQELENILAHAVVLCRGRAILPSHLPKDLFQLKEDFVEYAIKSEDPFKVMERQLVLKILSQTGWNYKEAAERLKLSRTTLWRKIKTFGIERSRAKSPTL